MNQTVSTPPGNRESITAAIERLGACIELVSIDPHFHGITVGLFLKDDELTVWSFSRKEGTEKRLEQIRDRLVVMGGLVPIKNFPSKAGFGCGDMHLSPLRFLTTRAVERSPTEAIPTGDITVKDLRSPLLLKATPAQDDGLCLYSISSEGEFNRKEVRHRAVIGGLMRYGGMQRVAPDKASFSCGTRHDELVRLLLPYARNVSAVEDMLASDDMAGQMTTQTLGFSST